MPGHQAMLEPSVEPTGPQRRRIQAGPHPIDVRQALLLRADRPLRPPSGGQLAPLRPDRVVAVEVRHDAVAGFDGHFILQGSSTRLATWPLSAAAKASRIST